MNIKQLFFQSKNIQTNTETIPRRMWRDLTESYKNETVLKWSVWYCLAFVGYMTVSQNNFKLNINALFFFVLHMWH